MPGVLLLTVRLHDFRYHGAGDSPPAPARLFQALLAGAGLSGPETVAQYADALEWLENLTSPIVAGPHMTPGREVTFHVPLNDLDSKGGSASRVGTIRVEKLTTPKLIDTAPDWLYAWEFNDKSEESSRLAIAVAALAEHLYQLGRGEDMAWAWGEIITPAELDERLAHHSGIVYRPSGVGRGIVLPCPTPGSLASLRERHQANSRRFASGGNRRGAKQTFQQPPKPRFVQVAYNSPAERYIYKLRDSDDREFRSWPLSEALTLTQTVRDGLANKLRRAYPDRLTEIEKIFIGRKANGEHDGPISERVRIIPLPSIGNENADCDIRRILVEVPAQRWFRPDDVTWALGGMALATPNTADESAFLTPSTDDRMLWNYGVSRASLRWRTVTPAALPGWIWRDIDSIRRTEEGRNAAARILREQAAQAVIKTLRFSDVLAPVNSVRVQREPFDSHGAMSDAFAVGTRFSKGRLWHVEIVFESPVTGPLVIGDGRFLGLGVMAPVSESFSLSAGAAGVAFITPHAVQQFRERIEDLPYNQALTAILHSLNSAGPPHPTSNGAAVYVRTTAPYRFRAIVRPPAPDRKLPAVVTILKG